MPAVLAFMAAFQLAAPIASPAAAQIAIEVPEATLTSALSGCEGGGDCSAALQGLLDQLAAANPGTSPDLILGSVLAALAAAYNAGTIPAGLAQVALTTIGDIAAAAGYTALANAALTASATVAAGDPIDLEAVAEASGSPA